MRIAPLFLALVAVLVALGAGCGTLSIGRPPSAIELQNDGSPEQRARLQKKYALAFREGWLERPGVTPEQVEAEINVDVEQVRTGAWSDEAAEHFASSEGAFEATDTALVGFDRFANSGTPPLILQAGGVLVGTAVGATLAAVNNNELDIPEDAAANQISRVSNGAFSGAFMGLLISLPLVIVYDWTVPALSAALSASDYRRGVRAYNKDLEARIAKASPPPAPAPPPPPPLPESAEPPALVDPPVDGPSG